MAIERKHIREEADRTFRVADLPALPNVPGSPQNVEAFAADHTRKCGNCEASPVVNVTGLCGPCTFGEADTADGNW